MFQSEYDSLNSFQQIVEICNLKAEHERLCQDFRKTHKRDVPWPVKSLSNDALRASEKFVVAGMFNHPIYELINRYRYLKSKIDADRAKLYNGVNNG